MLPHQQGQEDAHRLHQERSALRHREVRRTLSLRRTNLWLHEGKTCFLLSACVLALSAGFSRLLSISYLCFESSSSRSSSSKKNKVIKLVDITDIQKVPLHISGWDCTQVSIRLYTHTHTTFTHYRDFCFLKFPVQSAVSATREWDGYLHSNPFHTEGSFYTPNGSWWCVLKSFKYSWCFNVVVMDVCLPSLWCLVPWFTEMKPLRPSSPSTWRSWPPPNLRRVRSSRRRPQDAPTRQGRRRWGLLRYQLDWLRFKKKTKQTNPTTSSHSLSDLENHTWRVWRIHVRALVVQLHSPRRCRVQRRVRVSVFYQSAGSR